MRINKPALLALVALLGLFLSCQQDFSPNFDIISIHALKGTIFSETIEGQDLRQGGFSLISSQLGSLRRGSEPTIFMADNNIIHGTPAAYFSRGENIIDLLNYLGCDVLVADSREFYYGTQRLAELAQLAEFPFVSANLRQASDGGIPPYLEPYYYDRESNVLIIGLSSPNLITRNLPANVAGLNLISPGAAVRDALRRFSSEHSTAIRAEQEPSIERPFIVVNAVSHKLSNDDGNSILDELEEFEFIDLLILGERDLPVDGLAPQPRLPWYPLPASRDAIPAWQDYTHWHGRLVLVDDRRSDNALTMDRMMVRNSRPTAYDEFPLRSDLIEPDEEISELLFSIRQASESQLNTEIADMPVDLEHRFSGPSGVADLISDAIRDYSGADIALINSGSIRGDLPAGPVSLFDAYSLLPFESGLYSIEMSGEDILDVLRQSVSYFGDPENEKGFLQASGLRFSIEEDGAGYFINPERVEIGGSPIDTLDIYQVTITSYLYSGGDGYDQFSSFPVITQHADSLLPVFLAYLEEENIDPSAYGQRIRLILD